MWSNAKLPPLRATSFALVAALATAACAPVTAYNALVPKDAGGVLAKSDLVYGNLPRQKLDVFMPRRKTTNSPIIVFFYGGSWNSGRRQDYAFIGKALAAKGFVVVIADYRLVPDVRFPAFLEDGARAVLWAHKNARQFGGDPGRLFLVGHSAGAYNAAMIALDETYLRAIGSSPGIIKGVAALAGPFDFLPLDVASTKAAFGQARDLSRTQPINFVSRTAPAMFLATGGDDTTVEPRNTYTLADRLRGAGATTTVKVYPGVGHAGILLALSVPFRSKSPVLDDLALFIAQP